jgi:hypothetical protein
MDGTTPVCCSISSVRAEIIHLEHHVEVQDADLEERAETITNLEG